MGQKWPKNGPRYFFTPGVKKYFHFHLGSLLARLRALLGPPNFASWRVLAPSWTDFNFFLALLRRLLGPSGRRQGPPGGLPGAFLVLFVMMIIYIIEGVFLKNRRFMRVKRTILKVHLLALAILDPILSTCSSFEHQYTSQSIQLPLGNAGRHMSDPLPDAFFSPRTPPMSGF